MKLTNEILDRLIQEVLLEYQAEHCRGLPVKDKLECDKADEQSRERSAERRRKKEQHQTVPTEMQKLAKGIVFEGEKPNLAEKIKKHLLPYLTPAEIEQFRKTIKKPSQSELQEYCSKWKDAVDGALTVDPKDIADLKIKNAKQNKKQ